MLPPNVPPASPESTGETAPSSTADERWRIGAISLAVAIAAASLVTFCFAPRFIMWRGLSIADELPDRAPEFGRAIVALQQLDDLQVRIDDPTHQVIAWRLLFPVMWHYLWLPRWLYLAMPQIGCLLALWLVAALTYQRLGSWWSSGMATTSLAALSWFFVSSGWLLHFDSWLVVGLLAATFIPWRLALALSCLLTPWVDERFVIALPVTLAVRAVSMEQISQKRWRDMMVDWTIALAASVPYPMIRLIAVLHGDGNTSHYGSHEE
jgi:hypothetical protein